jgi:hypothetical protein
LHMGSSKVYFFLMPNCVDMIVKLCVLCEEFC